MLYVISHYWAWIFLAALGLGLITGFLTCSRERRANWFAGWMTWAAIAFIIGVLVVLFRLLEGRANLWLESLLAIFAAYIIGCCIGCWLKQLFAEPTPAHVTAGAGGGVAAPAAAFAYPAAPVNAPLAINSLAGYPGVRPPGLAKADGAPDNLTRINAIGQVDQKMLNDLGIFHNRQIAGWKPENALWINHHMASKNRVEDEGWIKQAAALANAPAGGASTSAAPGATAASLAAPAAAAALAAPPKPADPPAAAAVAASKPADPPPAARLPDEDKYPGQRPPSFAHPRGGKPDDLKLINGVGRQNEERLHKLGVWHFDQIANWSKANVDWAGSFLAFPGRIERENWVEQCKILARGGETDHSRRVHAGLVPTSLAEGQAGAARGFAAGDANAPHPGARPAGLPGPRGGKADDLKRISGVGRQNEERLNNAGIWHYSQIASWSDREIEWMSSFLAFPGRITREDWIGQARLLLQGLPTEFAKRVDSGEVPTSQGDLPKKD
ncbi:MAG: hypothetical protein FJX29_03505 [Alphaproteobacteria bacterium]|nr:hypothetical protein [Alphaproteobacteria bacterium]